MKGSLFCRLFAFSLLFAGPVLVLSCGGPRVDAYGTSKAVKQGGDAVTVELKNIQFSPQGIRIKTGTTVTWINDDSVLHNVRQVESVFLSPDVMQPGQSFSYRFDKPGTYRYQCTFHHPTMNGVVIVEAG